MMCGATEAADGTPTTTTSMSLLLAKKGRLALLVVLLLLADHPHRASGTPLSVEEARSILERWSPEVHGAVAVKVGEVPYQASIRLYSPDKKQHTCGGAILSPWHVLTAARCVSSAHALAPPSVYVVVGTVSRSSLDEGDVETVVTKVAHIARHPEFSTRDHRHDLAVLTLIKALPLDRVDRVASIPLPVGDIRVDIGTTCVVSGWGNNTALSPAESDALLTAEVPFIGRELCAQMYEPTTLPDGVICTAHQRGGAGACVGDTGGPLACNGFLAGTVSWGSGCGAGARPTVYTSLVDHVEWVREQMTTFPHASHRDSNAVRTYGVGSGAPRATPRTTTAAALLVVWLLAVHNALVCVVNNS